MKRMIYLMLAAMFCLAANAKDKSYRLQMDLAGTWQFALDRDSSLTPVSPLTRPEHPVFNAFPTDCHTNWQWFPIVKASRPMVLDKLPSSYRPIVQVTDNIKRNHRLGLIFELKVGKGHLLVCMSDLRKQSQYPEAQALYRSIINYMNSADFNPQTALTIEELREAFSATAETTKIRKLENISY